jgi:hypothetical protein
MAGKAGSILVEAGCILLSLIVPVLVIASMQSHGGSHADSSTPVHVSAAAGPQWPVLICIAGIFAGIFIACFGLLLRLRLVVARGLLGMAWDDIESPEQYPELQRLSARSGRWMRIMKFGIPVIWVSMAVVVAIMVQVQRNAAISPAFAQPASLSAGSSTHGTMVAMDGVISLMMWTNVTGMLIAGTGLVLLVVKRFRERPTGRKKLKAAIIVGLTLFVASIVTTFLLGSVMRKTVRREVVQFLCSSGATWQAKINGQAVPEPRKIVEALSKTVPMAAHHSHSGEELTVVLESGTESLTLKVGKDSSYPDEYWVYFPGYHHTSLNEIGKVQTGVFDAWRKAD